MKKMILALAVMAGAISGFSAQAGITQFTYAEDQSQKNWIGMPFAAAEDTFECAIFLQNDEYVKSGAKVIGLRVPVRPETTAKNYEGWVATELPKFTDSGVKQPAVQRKSGTVNKSNNTLEVMFDEPVDLTMAGLYIGYSMDVTKQGFQPIAVVPGTEKNSLYIRTTEVLYNWRDYYDTFNFKSCITVLLEGDFVELAVEPEIEDAFGVIGETENHTVNVLNGGSEAINNIDYHYTLGGKTYTGSHTFSPAIAGVPGTSASFKVELPAADKEGTNYIDFTIDKVNGSDNGSPRATKQFPYTGVKWKPYHRPVMEEYTGTWCGYCPRGLAGMEYLSSQVGEDFVCISVHYDDVMQVGSNFPGSSARSYPSMSLDRVINGDPFFGTSSEPVVDRYILTDYLNRQAVFAPADVDVETEWDDADKTAINVKASATFALTPYDGSTYSFGYALTHDGLTGSGDEWTQLNFYSTDPVNAEYLATELKKYGNLPPQISNFVFDDVLVYAAPYNGVSGSLPKSIERGETYDHAQKISLALCRNKKGANMIQDKEKLNVVVLLLKTRNGKTEICNARKVSVPGKAAVVEGLEDADVVGEAYYTLQGVKVANPDRGIYIKVSTLSDGTRRSEKLILH